MGKQKHGIVWPELHDTPPEQVADRLPKFRADLWRRMEAALFLMGITGWSLAQELAARYAKQFGNPEASAVSGQMKYLFRDHLAQALLVHYQKLPYFGSGLMAVCMTDLGKEVCRAYGWTVKESEWEKLIRLHEGASQPKHTALVLAFAQQARRRRFSVWLLPDVDGQAVPDMKIVSKISKARWYVEVESENHGGKPDKWRNQFELQGCAAVVTQTPQRRHGLVEYAQSLGIPRGFAADTTSLAQDKNNPPGWIWLEEWGRP